MTGSITPSMMAYGGTNTGYENVIVNPFALTGQALGLTNPATPTLTFYGIKGFSYSVERSTKINFSPVEVLWQTNLIQSGRFIYTDPDPPQPQASTGYPRREGGWKPGKG